jgi:hypothetical protein
VIGVCVVALTTWNAALAADGSEASGVQTVKVRTSDPAAIEQIEARGGRIVADYGGFVIAEVDGAVLSTLPAADAVELRQEENVIKLNAGHIDTAQPAAKALRKTTAVTTGKGMHLVQFVGPVQPAWLDELRKTGVEVVTYVPNNAYLVYGDADQLAGVQSLAAQSSHIQWDGGYTETCKIDPRAKAEFVKKNPAILEATQNLYAIQLVSDAATNKETLAAIDKLKLAPVKQSYSILNYVNVVVGLPADAVSTLAQQPDIVSIQPYFEPKLNCERQAQIVAGNISGNGLVGPGYLAWLASQGFTQAQFTASGFAVDVSDSGLDDGTTSPNHFGLYVSGVRPGTSRVIYNRLEGTANSGSTLKGCDGHGTINSHIIGGYCDLSGTPFADASGYHYGLGIAPFVKLGSSVVFDPSTFTSPNYANLQSRAYNSGARISSNSWGGSSSSYTTDSQAYDALVRDAQPTGSAYAAAGNQEMVIVFANGNDGPNASTVGEPATAKNVISVGAAENVQAFSGSDGCDVADSGANSANDIISFSSRGPTDDGRKKPDIVAPGTHVSGGVIQTESPSSVGTADSCYTGDGVCGGVSSTFFPSSGQAFYTASSGTSHSCPAVAGGTALIRQYFINQGLSVPSPAMTKAVLMNSARYMTGVGANDTLWSNSQGMGEMDLGEAFERRASGATILRDQVSADIFTASGQSRTYTGTIADANKPFRVTLAWTDAPGATTGAAYNNDLDLTVVVNGTTYKGNVFNGAYSTTGGSADPRNNVESVFLPAGLSGSYAITVTAANINSDGVPNSGGSVDQDFALVAYNANIVAVPVVAAAGSTISSEVCVNGVIEPGETVTVNFALSNVGTLNTTNVVATLDASGGVTLPSGSQTYGALVAGGAAVSRPFTFVAEGTCGDRLTATFEIQDAGVAMSPVTFVFQMGSQATRFTQNFDSVTAPALPSGWTATVASGSAAAWVTSTASKDTSPNSVFAVDATAVSDNRLESPSISITTGSAQLSFRHSYSMEDGFDGGVLEVSIAGGVFTDILGAGGSFVTGGYGATISSNYGNPLAGRQAWTGSSGGFVTTTVSLPASAAGQNIKLRWRLGSDTSLGATGWYVDSISVLDGYTCCSLRASADFDGDGDVDQTDYGHFQACLTGAGVAVTDADCQDADLDQGAGNDVDSDDFTVFVHCYSGPDIAADPACGN